MTRPQAFTAVFFALLLFCLLGGLVLYGPIGLFVGPVLVSLFMTALQIYREEYHAADKPSGTARRCFDRLAPPSRRYSMGIVIAIPPMTSFNLKSRFGLRG